MRKFAHRNARTLDEAASYLKRLAGKARILAGGTDLLGKMKDEIMPRYPEAVLNIKTIPGLEFAREEEGCLRVGALTRLEDIASDQGIRRGYRALAQAAFRTASPHIREMGTIGGNICQDIRCWYYRTPQNRFPCLRKGGGRCYAIEGDNRYHSIFGGSVSGGCLAVHPSDTAPALIALDAAVKTSKRTISAERFFDVGIEKTTVLDVDEIVTEITFPKSPENSASAFVKFAARKTIDFPIVNCAARISFSEGKVIKSRICLNAVYVTPKRCPEAEEVLEGRALNVDSATQAARAVTAKAEPLSHNRYMVPITEAVLQRTLLACCNGF